MTPCVRGSASAVPGNEGSTPTNATTMAPIAAPSMIRSATRTTPNSVASFKFSPLYYTAVLGEGFMIAIRLTLTIGDGALRCHAEPLGGDPVYGRRWR